MTRSWLPRIALLLAAATLILVATGALLTNSKGAPVFDSLHRRNGEIVGLLALVFAVLAWKNGSYRLKWLSVVAIAGVAGIGALGVMGAGGLFLGPLSHVFFALTALLFLFATPGWNVPPLSLEDGGWPSMRSLAILTPVGVLVQIVLGAMYRHQVLGLMPHVIGAIVVGLCALAFGMFAMTQYHGHPELRRPGHAVLMTISVQFLLGIGAFVARLLAEGQSGGWYLALSVAHVAFGALSTGVTVILSAQVLRHVRPRLEYKTAPAS
jgi:heme A synthase